MPPPRGLELGRFGELLQAEFANRLEHVDARSTIWPASTHEKALGDERLNIREHALWSHGPWAVVHATRPGARLDRLEGGAAEENGEMAEYRLLRRSQQVIAPRNRGAQRLLALR